MAEEREIGAITHYFGKVKVAAIKLTAPLAVGDTIRIKGHTTDLIEVIDMDDITFAQLLLVAGLDHAIDKHHPAPYDEFSLSACRCEPFELDECVEFYVVAFHACCSGFFIYEPLLLNF